MAQEVVYTSTYSDSSPVNFTITYDDKVQTIHAAKGTGNSGNGVWQQGTINLYVKYSSSDSEHQLTLGTDYTVVWDTSGGNGRVNFDLNADFRGQYIYSIRFNFVTVYRVSMILTSLVGALGKFLIEDDSGNIYTIVNDALSDITASVSSPLTAQDFADYGIDGVPASELLITLNSPSVYCWSDTEEISMTATMTALPSPQTIYSDTIDLTNPDVTGIESITATYEGSPVFAVSVDNTTWQIWDDTNEQWVTLSDTTTGMTPTVMADIATSDWSTLIVGATEIYIRWTLSAETDNVTQVLVDYTN